MIKRLFAWFLGIILLIVILCATNWYQTRKSLVNYSREIPAGTSLGHAKESARMRGFQFINYSSLGHTAYVTTGGVLGRYMCVIEHDGKHVLHTTLNFNGK